MVLLEKSQRVGFDGDNFKKIRFISAKNIEFWIIFVIKIQWNLDYKLRLKSMYHSIL